MGIDARDVLDPDAMTTRAFRGRVVGHFQRGGPNAWDDYKFVAGEVEEIDVLPGLKIQMERFGPRFRMRRQGRVVRVEWLPEDPRAQEADITERRARFMADNIQAFDEAQGQPAAVIASKLDD